MNDAMEPEEITNIEIYRLHFILKWHVFALHVTSVITGSVQVTHHAVSARSMQGFGTDLVRNSATICKLVDLIPALRQSDWRIPNWVSVKTVLSSSTNHGQTTARFRSFFR